VEDPALCELHNGDVASLVGVNFGNKFLVSCAYCIYLVPVDLEFVLCQSTYSSCCACKDHLQKSPSIIAQLLIQLGSAVSSLFLNLIKELSFCRKFRSSQKLHSVGSSDRFNFCEEFLGFSDMPIQPL
jgi:hypothetical protein